MELEGEPRLQGSDCDRLKPSHTTYSTSQNRTSSSFSSNQKIIFEEKIITHSNNRLLKTNKLFYIHKSPVNRFTLYRKNLFLVYLSILFCVFGDSIILLVFARSTHSHNSPRLPGHHNPISQPADSEATSHNQPTLDEDQPTMVEPNRMLWSTREQELFKTRILDSFGLEDFPERHVRNVTAEEYTAALAEYHAAVAAEEERKIAVAEARYRELYEEEDEEEEEDELVPPPVTAEYKFFSSEGTQRAGRGRRSLPNGDKIAHFHVSLPSGDTRMQVVSAKASFFKRGSRAADSSSSPGSAVLLLYRLDNIKRFRPKYKQAPFPLPESMLLKTLNISSVGDEWLDINVTKTVAHWINSSKSDTGVLIRCPDCPAAGITIRTGGTTHVPTLHIQTELVATKRFKRSRGTRRSARAKWRTLGGCKDGSLKGRQSSKCCRRSMKVRFDDLPKFDFIVAPREFDAFYCSGKCPARYNPANEHALLQSLLHMQKKNNIPKPCCTPTDLSGLHILHYDKFGKLKTDLWSDVIVTECSCA